MKEFFGFFKSNILLKKRCERKDTLFWSFIFATLQLMLIYTGGFVFGFASSYSNYLSEAFTAFSLSALLIAAEEILRAVILYLFGKIRMNRYFSFAVTALLFTAANCFIILAFADSNTENSVSLLMTAVSLLINSILLTFMCKKGGAAAGMIYSVFVTSFPYLVPFEPEIGDKMLIFIRMVLGLIFITVFDCAFTEDKKTKKRTFLSRKICSVSAVFAVAAVCVCVMFFCGMLPVQPVAVATGSMEPQINVGDVVIVSKTDRNLSEGDIIQFKKDGKTVIHRIVSKRMVNDSMQYITKGDANNAADIGYVTDFDIIGKVSATVPKIGSFSLWLHSNN